MEAGDCLKGRRAEQAICAQSWLNFLSGRYLGLGRLSSWALLYNILQPISDWCSLKGSMLFLLNPWSPKFHWSWDLTFLITCCSFQRDSHKRGKSTLSLQQTLKTHQGLGSKSSLLVKCVVLMSIPDTRCWIESWLTFFFFNHSNRKLWKRIYCSSLQIKSTNTLWVICVKGCYCAFAISLLKNKPLAHVWASCKTNYETRSPLKRKLQLCTHLFPGLPLCKPQLWTVTLLPAPTCH